MALQSRRNSTAAPVATASEGHRTGLEMRSKDSPAHFVVILLMSLHWHAVSAAEIHDPLLHDLIQPSQTKTEPSDSEGRHRSDSTNQIPAASENRSPSGDSGLGGGLDDLSYPKLAQRMVDRMRRAEQRIAQYDRSPTAPALQSQVLKELDWLIERVRKKLASEDGSEAGANREHRDPLRERSGVEPGSEGPFSGTGQPMEQGDTDSRQMARQLIKETWGHLPRRKRGPLLNAPVDQFLPKYEELIEDYYERLSRQRPSR